ncbi:MoaD/ThiS family protein [Bdellovibrio sp. SKB1291214]|uniref:MoaD/ThiS family protein n=1 Tax=Bdellovibrio sp. SKB1291214 TaxID=1732569 RepID=UPI00223FE36D|nr:MoaD/ThiS family protein [Bdellovibrio sp. SKB1291214]UYL07630.1 MoaD/ThiS family protein [Bdellovibrio sp. SKB1291214]
MKAHIRLHDDLNEYLPSIYKNREITFQCFQLTTLQEVIESLNVPISAMGLILVNGESASIQDRLKEGDRVSVFPRFEEIDVGSDLGSEAGRSSETPTLKESARFLAG